MTKYITATPGLMSGDPVIAGKRIPIAWIIYLLSQGYTLQTLQDDYPWVKIGTLQGVIDEIVEVVNKSPDVTKVPQVQTAS